MSPDEIEEELTAEELAAEEEAAAEEALATLDAGIEKEGIPPPIGECNEMVMVDGEEIIDLEDYLKSMPS